MVGPDGANFSCGVWDVSTRAAVAEVQRQTVNGVTVSVIQGQAVTEDTLKVLKNVMKETPGLELAEYSLPLVCPGVTSPADGLNGLPSQVVNAKFAVMWKRDVCLSV